MENGTFKKLLTFHGDHGKAIGLIIINYLLTIITLGIYYPWAKASYLQYVYGESEYIDTRFVFHGTGKEMFIGFLKAIGILIVIVGVLIGCMASQQVILMIVGFLFYIIAIMLLVPVAVHGSNKYRLSRTSWRGIHFGYRGVLKELVALFIPQMLLTVVTFGIYGSWMHCELRKYIMAHTRFGNVEFRFDGKGGDLFIIKLKGVLLSIITLGIYSLWYMKNRVAFEIDNTKVIQGSKEISIRSTLTAGQIFSMFFVNYLIIVFTLGIGFGIALNRFMRTVYSNIEFDDAIDATNLFQTEDEYKDASGDDLANMLDISI